MLHSQLTADDSNSTVTANYTDRDIMIILLSKIAKTAAGFDDIPYWLRSECATELYYVLSN